MSDKILIIGEVEGGRVRDITYELGGAARAIGGTVVTALLGDSVESLAQDATARLDGDVVAVQHGLLAHYTPDGYAKAIEALVAQEQPSVVLVGHTPMGWDLAPKLAAALDTGMVSECTEVGSDDQGRIYTRKVFNGKLNLAVRVRGGVEVVTVQKGAFKPVDGPQSGSVRTVAAEIADGDVRQCFIELKEGAKGKLDLTQHDVVVSGGRALGGPEKFDIIQALADALGGGMGSSRPVVDAGWLPPEHQVGSSGANVSPKLYVACGISGAIQHIVGMKDSETIIAINKDANAPIFEIAHYGVVADLFELVPALTKAVQEAKGA